MPPRKPTTKTDPDACPKDYTDFRALDSAIQQSELPKRINSFVGAKTQKKEAEEDYDSAKDTLIVCLNKHLGDGTVHKLFYKSLKVHAWQEPGRMSFDFEKLTELLLDEDIAPKRIKEILDACTTAGKPFWKAEIR